MRLNDVSPAFLRAVIAAAQANSDDQYEVVGASGRRLYDGAKSDCEAWVAAGNVGGAYSIERIAT